WSSDVCSSDLLGHALGRAAVLHELAENAAQQEHEKPGLDEAAEPRHVGADIVGPFSQLRRKQWYTAAQGDQDGAQGGGNQQVHAPDGEVDQEGEGGGESENAEHDVLAYCGGRAWWARGHAAVAAHRNMRAVAGCVNTGARAALGSARLTQGCIIAGPNAPVAQLDRATAF